MLHPPKPVAARLRPSPRASKRATRALLLALPALALLLVACEQRALVPINERYEVSSLARLRLLVEDGAVTVAEGRPGAIVVTGEHPEDVHEYSATVAAAEARIELRQPRGLRFALGQRGAHLEVLIPPGTAVEVESSNGPVEVTGPFRVERVKASNGPVTVVGSSGPLAIENSNGRVRVERHDGPLVVRGSNGAIEVTEQRDGQSTLTTSNGAIRYQGTIDENAEHLFETSNGAVEVIVAGTPAFTLDASTSNGGLTSGFALRDGIKTESRLTGRVGDGDARLVIRTSNGPVEVR